MGVPRGTGFDGEFRTDERPGALASPFDRGPIESDTPAASVPASTAKGLLVLLAPWVRWVQVDADGGAGSLIVYPGRNGIGRARVVQAGDMFFVPDGAFKLTDNGTAPTSAVSVTGYNSADAHLVTGNSANVLSPVGNPKNQPSADADAPKFASVIAGAQLISGALAAGGATARCIVLVSGDFNNTKGIFLGRTQAQAASLGTTGGTPVYAAGQDEWVIPPGGQLWQAAADTLQTGYFRVRT